MFSKRTPVYHKTPFPLDEYFSALCPRHINKRILCESRKKILRVSIIISAGSGGRLQYV